MDCHCDEPKKEMCPMPDVVERPILFRLVKIASTIGDETAFPPTVGLYRNVLLNYEVNNHSYMYSSDGIPVLLSTESIPGDSGIKILTTDDYNWSSPGATEYNAVDPVLLSPGVYITDPTGDLQVRGPMSSTILHAHGALISVSQGSSDSSRQAFMFYSGVVYQGAAASPSNGMARWTNNDVTVGGWMPPTSNVTKALNDKIPVVTLQTTDPGENTPLEANHFIGVYNA